MTAAAPTSAKPRILISRAIFPQVVDRLASHFDVESNQADELWSPQDIARRLQGKQGALTTGGDLQHGAVA